MNKRPWWSIHTHSRYSANDAMPQVAAIVNEAARLEYPALGLTDHGNVSGSVQLYKACRKQGIEPLPGIELYVVPDRESGERSNHHLTVVAYSETGYRNLVKMSNLAAMNYWYKPRLDMSDLAILAEDDLLQGLVVSTGCYFGLVQQTLVHRGEREAQHVVETFAKWFPKCYVELQNHEIGEQENGWDDDMLVEALVDIADRAGVPYLIAQDSHYISADQQPLHDALKTMVSFADDPSEATFPGGPYSMVDRKYLGRLYEPVVLDRAIDNLAELADRAHVRLPELEQFSMKVPDVTIHGEPDNELWDLVLAVYKIRYPDRNTPEAKAAKDRLTDEMGVIEDSGFAGYILLIWWICNLMRERGIWFHARGSAAGSFICYLLGITQVDPIAGGLRMDRFLSRDRTRPPDVDLDVEHERRDEVIAELSERFSVRQVGSHMQYSLWEEDEGDVGKGSLMVRYHTSARKSGVTDKLPWRDIPKADKDMLVALGNMKLISGPGTHAAGYIVAPDEAAVSELPLNWIASRKAFVTAYAKKDVEALGFVKVDLLGLRTLTAIRVTCTEIARQMSAETGEEPDPQGLYESIPINDRATLQKIGSGNNIGVFQLEGFAMSKGCERLKPKKMDDIIAAQALFRPATMGSGATSDYIGRRNKTEQVPSRHIDIQQETAETYGVLLYQEQVIGVLRRMGMPADELTNMLDAVKASNEASAAAAVALEQAKPRIRQLAGDRGWAEPDIDWLISALVAYGEYSFNKAHAASYGLVAYRTAYLATHYPTEFWLGMVTAFSNHPKENDYVRAARSQKVQVLPAHVNKSGVTYSIDGKVIRKGLLSVKGVGKISAEELVANQPYRDLRDLGERVTPRKVSGAKGLALGKDPDECGGVISHLAESGALHGLEREVQLELS